ncbi:hypothetical protein Q1695_005216 [Nippostrongylus brasiliensis]|nr:hypothetical protein Q1695_005216 [Nippostrongylus brasiliensis]
MLVGRRNIPKSAQLAARRREVIGKTPMEKVQKIARGAKKDENAYPTFDDVMSDWEDEKKCSKERIQPRKMELDEKQKMIAKGAKRDTSAYPTLDDVPSDWDSGEEDSDAKKGKKKKGKINESKLSLIGPPGNQANQANQADQADEAE